MKRVALLGLCALAACGSHPDCANCEDARLADGGPQPSDAPSDAEVTPDSTITPDAAIPPDAGPFVPPDPFTLPSCPAATFAQLSAMPGGAKTFTLTSRTRSTCDAMNNCSAWVFPSPVQLAQILARAGYPSGTPHSLPASGTGYVWLQQGTPQKIGMEFQGTEPGAPTHTIRFRCEQWPQNGIADNIDCSVEILIPGDYPTLMDFVDFYAGHPLFDNTTMVSWRGTICDDGRFQLVTKLATDLGTLTTGANNRNQLAIYGQL